MRKTFGKFILVVAVMHKESPMDIDRLGYIINKSKIGQCAAILSSLWKLA